MSVDVIRRWSLIINAHSFISASSWIFELKEKSDVSGNSDILGLPKFLSLRYIFFLCLSFIISHADIYLPKDSHNLSLSLSAHFLTKRVEGGGEGEEAFTQFITGHPSLSHFCLRLSLYSMPFKPGGSFARQILYSVFWVMHWTSAEQRT